MVDLSTNLLNGSVFGRIKMEKGAKTGRSYLSLFVYHSI